MKKELLKSKLKNIFIRYGLSNKRSLTCADALINAELVGVPSHGLSRLTMYYDRIKKKVINIPKNILEDLNKLLDA